MKAVHIVYSGLGGASSLVFSLIEADKKKKIKTRNYFYWAVYFKRLFN